MKFKGLSSGANLSIVAFLVVISGSAPAQTADYFPSFADEHTVGLWLFDETDYPYTTLTDASRYEYDLRLMKGGKLVPGKFGGCLKLTPGLDFATGYAAWKGMVGFTYMREVSGRPGSGLWGPTVAPKQLLETLAGRKFTCEFWLMLMSSPIQEVVLIDLGDKYEPGFALTLKERASGFVVENAYAGFKAVCPAELKQIWGRAWHHIAFTYSPASKTLRYFIDGMLQSSVAVAPIDKSVVPPSIWPESLHHTTYDIFKKENRRDVPDFETRRKNRFNFALGHDRRGEHDFNGNLDELRFSDVIRYSGDFAVPASFSRNYGRHAPKPSVANGPPLLFGRDKTYLPNEPVRIGSCKHVFIDDVIIERKQNVRFTVNPPTDAAPTNIRTRGDTPVFDHDEKVWVVQTPGYGSAKGNIALYISEDGLNFEKPSLGIVEQDGSRDNNFVLSHVPCWGRFFKDTNPNAGAEERFKFTGWIAQRGIYLYVSPDGIHWRRNETCMLPFVSGGGCETFWDDQRGVYVNLLKRDGSYSTGEDPAYGRSATLFETREVTKAWPIKGVPNPYYEGWPFPAVTGEGITVMGPDIFNANKGQVFRTRTRKYPWAPDMYVAFLARNARTELAVSRDCIHWHIFDRPGDAAYLPRRLEVAGKSVNLDWILDGLIRRGGRIWQYVNTAGRRTPSLRLLQRLDGFVSLDAGDQTGIVVTKPVVFEGDRLILNINSAGLVRVAITNLPGTEMSEYGFGPTSGLAKGQAGFGIANCDPIKADSVRQVVTWNGGPDVSSLAGKVVRLRFEMQNAKLYAFKFE